LRRAIGYTFIALKAELYALTRIDLVIPTHACGGKGVVARNIGIPTTGARGAIGITPINGPTVNWNAGVIDNAHGGNKTITPFTLNNIFATGCLAGCGMQRKHPYYGGGRTPQKSI